MASGMEATAPSEIDSDSQYLEEDPVPEPEAQILSQIQKIDQKIQDKLRLSNYPNGAQAKKSEDEIKRLKKLIVTLTFTGPIEKSLAKAEQSAKWYHEFCWELGANRILLCLEAAAQEGDLEKMSELKRRFIENGRSHKNGVQEALKEAKRDILKQCEEGVQRMLEALEKSNRG